MPTPSLLVALLLAAGLVVSPAPEEEPQMLLGEFEPGGHLLALDVAPDGHQSLLWYIHPDGPPVLERFDPTGRPVGEPRPSHLDLLARGPHQYCTHGAAVAAAGAPAGRSLVALGCQVDAEESSPGRVLDLFVQPHDAQGPLLPAQRPAPVRRAEHRSPQLLVHGNGDIRLLFVEQLPSSRLAAPGKLRTTLLDDLGEPIGPSADLVAEESVDHSPRQSSRAAVSRSPGGRAAAPGTPSGSSGSTALVAPSGRRR